MVAPTASEWKSFGRIAVICCCWYVVSSANGVFGKWILSEFPHPMTVTLVQLLTITIMSRPLMLLLGIRGMAGVSWRYYARNVIPLAAAKFLSSVLAHISIWKVPVSYAHTVKASMPFFTVILCRLFVGTRFSTKTYLSLFPIILGVAVATVTEISFDILGLASALAATAGFSAMTIMTKKVTDETGVHSLRLLLVLGQLSFIMFLPVWVIVDLPHVIAHPLITAENATFSIFLLLLIDGIFHWMQNILAFTLMRMVTPLTYSVANVTKRIAIISFSLMMLQNEVTPTNVLGMSMAVGGVFMYNKVKLDEKHAESLPKTLPNKTNNNKPFWSSPSINGYGGPKVQVSSPLPAKTNGVNNNKHSFYSGNGGISGFDDPKTAASRRQHYQ